VPKVSIIIRSYNDIEYIEQTMINIKAQIFQDYELINVDCDSKDGTWEIIQKYNDQKAYQIKPADYIPGKVLNNAIEQVSGDIIVFNNSDCVPQNEYWLEKLIAPLDNENVAATFGNQLPRKDAKPLIVKDNTRAFGDGNISAEWKHFFSLATSAVPTDLIRKYPFDNDIQYSEDIEWSWRLKKKGYKLIYVPDSLVEHSHNYTIEQVYKRFHGEGVAEGKIYREKLDLVGGFLKPAVVEIARDIKFLFRNGPLFYIPYSFLYRIVQKYAVYRGNLDFYRRKIS